MSDLISRQAMKNMITNHWSDFSNAANYRTALACVDAVPTVTFAQPEIIRCKDCKHYGRADKRRFFRGYDCLDGRIASIVPDKDFCSRAERREVTE